MNDVYLEMVEKCASARLRKAARDVTNFFDRELRPSGMRSTQLSAMVALAAERELKMSELAAVLGLDRTSVTRLVGHLVKKRFIKDHPGIDRRARILSLTPLGDEVLKKSSECWSRAQKRIIDTFGEKGWEEILRVLERLSILKSID